jgi:hypothetical protein
MEVRTGHAAGSANFAENGAGVDEIAGLNGNRLKVSVKGVQAEAVVDDYSIAGEVEWLG